MMMMKMICLSLMLVVTSSLAYCGFLMADDAMDTSSFNTAGNWDDGIPPVFGMDYVTQGYLLRTPSTAGNYTFEGLSLTIGQGDGGGANPFLTDGNVNSNALINKTPGNPVIFVNNLILDGGTIRDGMGSTDTWTLDGNLVINLGGLAAQCQFYVASVLSGSGPLYIATNGNGDLARTIYILNPSNSYNGSIYLLGADSAYSRLTFVPGSRMNFVIGSSGLSNTISGTGTATFDGIFAFDLSSAGTNVGDSWSLASVTSQTFGSTFTVEGFTDMGLGIWTTKFNGTHYQFNANTGVLSAWLGSGIPEDPYQVWTPQEMNAIGANSSNWDKYYKLMADLDMSALLVTPYNIGNETTPFTGTFDGNRHVINNLATDKVGLFDFINGGTVRNLGLESVAISTTHGLVGALAGSNVAGTITNCYAKGTVHGMNYVGGLVGFNQGTITNCYTNISVSGNQLVGGLVGENDGTLTNCYAAGSVSGVSDVGGLAGFNQLGTIAFCYAAGPVSGSELVGGLVGETNMAATTDSFWDTQTSGQSASAGGTGKTTAQMKNALTFSSEGWDFVNVWNIVNRQTYPLLRAFSSSYNPADINYSGTVDMDDLMVIAANWLEGI